MPDFAVITALRGARVIGPSGESLGQVTEVFLDAESRQPTFVEVDLGEASKILPTAGLQLGAGIVRSPYSRATVAGAPKHGRTLSAEDEQRILDHFGRHRRSGGRSAQPDAEDGIEGETAPRADRSTEAADPEHGDAPAQRSPLEELAARARARREAGEAQDDDAADEAPAEKGEGTEES